MSVCGSVRGLETWDPRRDAHSNSKFNSYPNGIGRDVQAQHQQQNGVVPNGDSRHVQIMRRDSSEKRPTKLYITGAPRRCTTTSLEEMFNKYGEVLEVSRGTDQNNHQLSRLWVTYGSFREANAAIQSLDGVKIDEVHQLRVCVALSEEEIVRRKEARVVEENHLAAITQTQQSVRCGAVSPKPRSLRSCIGCGKQAGQQCGSCKEPYCSRDCQTQDWYLHKDVCAKKKLELVKNSRASTSPPPPPRLEFRVLKTGVTLPLSVFDATDPGDFAVLDAVEGDIRYVSMESALAELTEQLRQTPTMKAYNQEDASDPCAAGSGVLAFFEEQFSRAIVIKAPSQTPDGNPLLWFADYGNTSSTPLDDVRPLPAQFADLPSRVVPCALANVRPKNGALVWPTDVQLMLKQLLLKDLKIIVKDIQKDFFPRHKVDVLSGDDDLATVLVDAGYADWIRPPEIASAPIAKPAPAAAPQAAATSPPPHLPGSSESVKVGDVFEATVVYHAEPGNFFVWKVDDEAIGAFAEVSESLNTHYAGSKPDPNFSPAPGDYVAAWVVADSQWCRACVLAHIDSSGLIAIRYLDYGEEASLNPAQLRPITSALLGVKLPAMAISCETSPKLFPLPEAAGAWSPESKAFFEAQFPVFGSITVEVLEKNGAGTLFVFTKRADGVSMTDLLTSSGHATKLGPSVTNVPLALPPSPPQEIVMANSVPAFPMENLRGKDRFTAIVPHLTDWQNLFVQPFTEVNQLHMIKVNDEITKAWQGRSETVSDPKVGQLILAKDVDDGYYRAEVVSVDATTDALSVKFLDYGNSNIAFLANCLPPTPGLVNLHVLGFWAPLQEKDPSSTNGVAYDLSGPINPEALATLTSLPQIETRLSEAGAITEIQTPEKKDVLQILGLPVKPPPVKSSLRAENLPLCPFVPPSDPSTPPIDIIITDVQSLQRIFVQCLTQDMAVANDALTTVMSTTMEPVVGNIAVGDLLAVPFSDGCLYRAEVIDIQANGNLAVHFVDYGNCFVAPRSSALTLPANSLEIPPLAFAASLNDEAYIIPTGNLDASTVAQLTVETPTYNISIPTADAPSPTPLPPSKRPSIKAVIKDSAKTLSVLDVLAAAGTVKLRTVQSPSPPAAKAAASPVAAAPVAAPVKFRADAVPPCPYVPDVGEANKIVVTEVVSLNQIYVQVVVPEFLDVLSAVETSIFEIEPHHPTDVGVGDLALALFEDGAFYRAEIIEVSEEDVKVSFLDYGNLVTLSRSKLRSPSKKLSQYPRLCFCVKVSSSTKYSVSVCNLDDSILSWLKNPAPSFDLSIVNPKSQSAPRNCALSGKITDVNGTSIVDFLGDAGYLKVKTSPSDTSLVNPTDQPTVSNESDNSKDVEAKSATSPPQTTLKELPFPSPGEFILTHFNSAVDFFLQNEDCVVAAVQLQSTVDAHVAASKSFAETRGKPEIGSLVLSQFEGVFYRAFVLSIADNDVFLHFVDYGNDAHAPTSAIYPASEEIRKVPKLCFRCTTAEGELNNMSADDETALRSYLPDGCFFIVEEVRLMSDQRHLIAPVEGKEPFIALVKKYQQETAAPVALAAAPTVAPAASLTVAAPAHAVAPPTPVAITSDPIPSSPLPEAGAIIPYLKDMKQGHENLMEGPAVGCDINEFINPLEMYLALKEETFDMLALAEDLAAYGPVAPPLLDGVAQTTLSTESVVVAFWLEGWYRAVLLNDVTDLKPDTIVAVRFIDYGNCDQVALKDVRPILPKHFDVPVQSLRCRLSGISLPDGATEWSPDVPVLLQETLASGAASTCKVRKLIPETNVFLVVILFNEVPLQKTLVGKGLASKANGNGPAAATKLQTVQPAPATPTAASPTPVPAPTIVSNTTPVVPPSRSVSVIPKSAPSEPAMMVPRSLKMPPPTPSLPTPSRPEKTIAIASLQIGSESNNVFMFAAGVNDFAILCTTSDLAGYPGIEETILASTNNLMAKRGKFEDPKRQLQRGGAVLALFEGQFYRAVITAAFEEDKPDTISVWFVDYGNSASLPQSDLVEIPADLVKLPALCAPCGLRGALRPRPGAVQHLNDLVNAEVVVQCHEIDSRGAIPKMIVTLIAEGVDICIKLRNEGLLELDGDEVRDPVPAATESVAAISMDVNNNVEVAVVEGPRNVDINNNVVEDPEVTPTIASPQIPAMDSDTVSLREENEKLKKHNLELTEKISELSKKHEEGMKKMEKKIDILKSLI